MNPRTKYNRRAWIFADTPAGADASAIHYSLIETAKCQGLEPYAYLNAVLKALPYADTVEKCISIFVHSHHSIEYLDQYSINTVYPP